jgi:hypothetical protein
MLSSVTRLGKISLFRLLFTKPIFTQTSSFSPGFVWRFQKQFNVDVWAFLCRYLGHFFPKIRQICFHFSGHTDVEQNPLVKFGYTISFLFLIHSTRTQFYKTFFEVSRNRLERSHLKTLSPFSHISKQDETSTVWVKHHFCSTPLQSFDYTNLKLFARVKHSSLQLKEQSFI